MSSPPQSHSSYVIIGRSKLADELRKMVAIASSTDQPVLITGETGSGKEFIAQAIHFNSSRASYPFISIHCSSLPEELAENELFGENLTSLDRQQPPARQKGKWLEATGGSLFFDEIEELKPSLQSKILRLFDQSKKDLSHKAIRIIASNKGNLEKEMHQGHFRKELFFRLNVIRIRVPSLRERKEDITDFVHYFISKYSKDNPKHISKKALEVLLRYHWPGNIRELENLIIRLCLTLQKRTIDPLDIDLPFVNRFESNEMEHLFNLPLPKALEELEQMFIQKALAECPTRSAAAKKLGIVRPLLYAKLRKYDIR
ncbi:sigma 54-interacting transcriptional regulator [Methylacidiphilum caldifontis]|uniref:AAA family ATPase n=1 Tax=Methylacidiphilum caldifontis TaxID=2795386 RepID=A0A4Y8PBE9_9BACT|nr:sigma 54-interacting transcriptional regulator [Methylacidiphilum caldifontis]QSR88157.1 sigma-54-dependent Fis family transcriptional regulator [Methylacidiphilum caldifontis]TFE68196.1 AAA family ATPase [Methylacidiphilum caldifontis]